MCLMRATTALHKNVPALQAHQSQVLAVVLATRLQKAGQVLAVGGEPIVEWLDFWIVEVGVVGTKIR